jgi:hypothetical protein
MALQRALGPEEEFGSHNQELVIFFDTKRWNLAHNNQVERLAAAEDVKSHASGGGCDGAG